MDWERIESRGAFMYWRRRLADGSYLSVTRQLANRWRWQHRGPDTVPGGGTSVVHGEGFRASMRAARNEADRHVQPRCPSCASVRLQWCEDNWACLRCGDEWSAEQIESS